MRTFIPFTSDEEVVVIGCGLLDRTLPKTMWTHAAHFEATGGANTDSSGYHETITQASIRAASAFLSATASQPLFVTCNSLMRSHLGEPDWLLEYWTRERLFSVEARRVWVEPDIRGLPF